MFREYHTIADVQPNWDKLALTYFQRRKFLEYAEKYNYCAQRYYELIEDNELQAGACVYSLRMDLLTFAKIKSPLNFNIIGIPASVSDSGIIGRPEAREKLLGYILKREKGLTLVLNLPPGFHLKKTLSIRTLPTVCLEHDFNSWQEYMKALRSPYRRRLNLIKNSSDGIQVGTYPCSSFNEELYDLYMQIMRRTKTKLETLNLDFFKNLPSEFSLTTYSRNGNVINWHIVVREEKNLVFFYGGTDYRQNRLYNGYFNNLIGILKEGIETGCNRIEFGQTAELAKARLGGSIIEKQILVYSNNALTMGMLRLVVSLLSYRRKVPVPHVFRDDIITGRT